MIIKSIIICSVGIIVAPFDAISHIGNKNKGTIMAIDIFISIFIFFNLTNSNQRRVSIRWINLFSEPIHGSIKRAPILLFFLLI